MNKEISQIYTETKNMLDIIFEQREDEIYKITENERKLILKKSEDYSKIYIAINNIPNGFGETIKGIKTSIETYIDTISIIQGNENEKFYKKGFSDAIQLVMECINENSENKKSSSV